MKISQSMKRKEFAAAVVHQLDKHGISCVLVGGACVSIYTMYSPTQCVMDRLAAWFHWNDRRSLIHALWVCEKHPINLDKIKRWAAKEGETIKLDQFIEEYKKAKALSKR